MICFTLTWRVPGQSYGERNCATQSRMCAAKDTRGYLSARSSTRCILVPNYSIASPLSITLDMRKSLSSKRRSVSNKSQRKEKDPDLVRLSTRSPGREGIPEKISVSDAGAVTGEMCGGRADCRREDEDGREEGATVSVGLQKPHGHFCRSPGMMMLGWFCSVCS
jgi:hypothetical protein